MTDSTRPVRAEPLTTIREMNDPFDKQMRQLAYGLLCSFVIVLLAAGWHPILVLAIALYSLWWLR